MRYGDIHEIKEIVGRYGAEKCKRVWEHTLIPDERIKKIELSSLTEIKKHFEKEVTKLIR